MFNRKTTSLNGNNVPGSRRLSSLAEKHRQTHNLEPFEEELRQQILDTLKKGIERMSIDGLLQICLRNQERIKDLSSIGEQIKKSKSWIRAFQNVISLRERRLIKDAFLRLKASNFSVTQQSSFYADIIKPTPKKALVKKNLNINSNKALIKDGLAGSSEKQNKKALKTKVVVKDKVVNKSLVSEIDFLGPYGESQKKSSSYGSNRKSKVDNDSDLNKENKSQQDEKSSMILLNQEETEASFNQAIHSVKVEIAPDTFQTVSNAKAFEKEIVSYFKPALEEKEAEKKDHLENAKDDKEPVKQEPQIMKEVKEELKKDPVTAADSGSFKPQNNAENTSDNNKVSNNIVPLEKAKETPTDSENVQNTVMSGENDQAPMKELDPVAEAKEQLKNFDKSQLVFTLKGSLDHRYNSTWAYLNLLRLAGESEQSTYVNVYTDTFIMYKKKGAERDEAKQYAESVLKNFDTSTLIYTMQGRLDMRYNHNKEYLRLVALSEDPERMQNSRPPILVLDW